MDSYKIFDETYYLSQYPWVKVAIEQGVVQSGLQHFQWFGQAAGLTEISRYFDEQYYLANNPELIPFVKTADNPNAPFASGLDHFLQFGYVEGRTLVSPNYDENFYLAVNPDVLAVIAKGFVNNGYQHFILAGGGRETTNFSERVYLYTKDDIQQAVDAGLFKTRRDHYFQYGQFEPSRTAKFIGTSGNDNITAVGMGTVEIYGVDQDINGLKSYGSNEFDTLTGSNGQDTFVLGRSGIAKVGAFRYPFYIGPGFALIENFTPGEDRLDLVGSLENYLLMPINNNQDLAIQSNNLYSNLTSEFSSLDTLAVIKDGGNFTLTEVGKNSLSFYLG